MEIVIKSLEQNYTTVEGLAGASILGDGSICLILDIQTMINRVISQQEKLSQEEREKLIADRLVDSADYEDMEEEDYSSMSKLDKQFAAEELKLQSEKPNYISDVIVFDDEKNIEEEKEAWQRMRSYQKKKYRTMKKWPLLLAHKFLLVMKK
jgi:chemotaxis protein histidine kinase CheA